MSDTKEDGFVDVGGKAYKVVKTGREQAEQVVLLTRWLSAYGPQLLSGIQQDEQLPQASGLDFITGILGKVTSDALVDLFQVLVGCSKKDADKYFDIGILVDVALDVYENQPGIQRLIDRFFSTDELEESTEDSSMKSEEGTDTQTTLS